MKNLDLVGNMFIRRTVSKNKKYDNEKYYTYRLVESYRVDGKVKQRVLLNLGATFSIDKDNWSALSTRIEDIIKKRESLFEIDKELELLAQQYALQIISASSEVVDDIETDYQNIDVNTIEQIDPKTIGCEHIVYETIKELELSNLFESLNFTPIQTNSAIGCRDASHLATPRINTWPPDALTFGHRAHLKESHQTDLMRL